MKENWPLVNNHNLTCQFISRCVCFSDSYMTAGQAGNSAGQDVNKTNKVVTETTNRELCRTGRVNFIDSQLVVCGICVFKRRASA